MLISWCSILVSSGSVSGAGKYDLRADLPDLFLSGWRATAIRSCSLSRKDERVGSSHVLSSVSFSSCMLSHIRKCRTVRICAKPCLHSFARSALLSSETADHCLSRCCVQVLCSSNADFTKSATLMRSDFGPKWASSSFGMPVFIVDQ